MSPSVDLLVFAGLMALAQLSPGPDLIIVTRTSLAEGSTAGIHTAWGIACGMAIHAGLAVGGLAVALSRSAGLQTAFAWAAAGYLLYLAAMLLRPSSPRPAPISAVGRPSHAPFIRGLICNLLNAKAVIFIAALAAHVLTRPQPGWMPAALWTVVVMQAGVFWSLWACTLQWQPLRRWYETHTRWIDRIFASALVLLAVRLLLGH